MKEEFLQAVWKHHLYDAQRLQTLFEEPVKVIKKGIYNRDSGPDFQQAIVQIGNTKWAGAVEIHVRSSHWYQHQHQSDPAYDNVVLHVVWEDDRPVYDRYGVHVPTVELKNIIHPGAILNFDRLALSDHNTPCSGQSHRVLDVVKATWIERMGVERLQNRRNQHLKWLGEVGYRWDGALFIALARAMGFGVNSDAMELLAKSIPFNAFLQIEKEEDKLAVLLGLGGFLTEDTDDYIAKLRREWNYRKAQLSLRDAMAIPWKFSKMRPANTPVIRLVQFAALLSQKEVLDNPEKYLAEDAVDNLSKMRIPDYWKNHIRPGVPTKRNVSNFAKASSYKILTNAIVPLVFTRADYQSDFQTKEKVIDFLHQLPHEDNRITRVFTRDNWKNTNAFESQAYYNLYNAYCVDKKCLSCSIGVELLKAKK